MFVSQAPFLGSVSGASQLRIAAVKLQNYADVNKGSQPSVLAFWNAQKALADVDHGLPYDGTYVAGVADVRPVAYKVLSHYRMFNKPGLDDFKDFCQFFIELNGGKPAEPLKFTKNLPTTLEIDGTGSLSVTVAGGKAPYTYAWSKDGKVVAGQTGVALTVTEAGEYQVVVTDSASGTISSNKCAVTVKAVAPLVFSKDLAASIELEAGQQLGLEVAVTGGVAPYKYQWKRGTAAIGSDKPTYGPTSPVAGNYTCTVTDAAGTTAVSTTCVVTIKAA